MTLEDDDGEVVGVGDHKPQKKESERLAALCALYQLDAKGLVRPHHPARVHFQIDAHICLILCLARRDQGKRRRTGSGGGAVGWDRCRIRPDTGVHGVLLPEVGVRES